MFAPLSTNCSSSPSLAFAAAQHIAEHGIVDQRERARRAGGCGHRCPSPPVTRGSAPMNQPPARGNSGRQRDQRQAGNDGIAAARQNTALLLRLVAASEGLRDEARGARAQEIEGGEDDVEDDRACGQAAEQRGIADIGRPPRCRPDRAAASSDRPSVIGTAIASTRRLVTTNGRSSAADCGAGPRLAWLASMARMCNAGRRRCKAALPGRRAGRLQKPARDGRIRRCRLADRPPSRLRCQASRPPTAFRWANTAP